MAINCNGDKTDAMLRHVKTASLRGGSTADAVYVPPEHCIGLAYVLIMYPRILPNYRGRRLSALWQL